MVVDTSENLNVLTDHEVVNVLTSFKAEEQVNGVDEKVVTLPTIGI